MDTPETASLVEARRTADTRAQFLQRNFDAALRVQASTGEQIAVLDAELASIRAEFRRAYPLKALLAAKLTGKFKGIETDTLEKFANFRGSSTDLRAEYSPLRT